MSSDQEASGSSSALSPHGSPYGNSSPTQQIPQLTNFLTQLKCADNAQVEDNKPYLRITEQPQDHFRFRYRSEMLGTHGCIFGRSHITNKDKSHPTVELVNYNGSAIITCCLAQYNNYKDHPHQLFEDARVKDSTELPVKGSYKVAFPDMGVIHNSKNEVKEWLFRKFGEEHKRKGISCNVNQLRAQSDNCIKEIEMNIVRLKFSARDARTGLQICEPVFSDPIHNMKSAATNGLKICRLSRGNGSVKGGDDIIMLCEKVNKKNIKIRFFEMKDGVRIWTDMGIFMPSDVHHQYAITFRTPQYQDPKITSDVTVYIELYRPSDNRCSEPIEFTYLADKIYKYGKKRRANSSLSSLTSSSGGSVKSLSDLPVIIANHTSLNENQENVPMSYNESPSQPAYNMVQPQPYSGGDLLGEALHQAFGSQQNAAPMLPLNVVPGNSLNFPQQPPELQINSEDFERLLRSNPNFSEDDRQRIIGETNWTEYLKALSLETGGSMDYVADSGRKQNAADEPTRFKGLGKMRGGYIESDFKKAQESKQNAESTSTSKAQEIKQIVADLVNMMSSKTKYKKQDARQKLERLFEIRFSNGDTFLHLALRKNQPNTDYIIKMVKVMEMSHLLNYQNKQLQTVLHLAVANDMPQLVEQLVASGCDPSLQDYEGNSPVHYAVIFNACLQPLLKAIKTNEIECELNLLNHELNTPLHLTTLFSAVDSAKLLLANGADYKAMDGHNRTVLHLAAYDGRLDIFRLLMEYVDSCDIDMVDGRGITALQIVCGREMTEASVEMARLLLQKQADPKKKGSDGKSSACKLAEDKPELRRLIAAHMKLIADVKSEEEYQSADEGDGCKQSLAELPLFIKEVSEVLDASDSALYSLAAILDLDAPLSGTNQISSAEFLMKIKESKRELSSASLANILENIGEKKAAQIIIKYVRK